MISNKSSDTNIGSRRYITRKSFIIILLTEGVQSVVLFVVISKGEVEGRRKEGDRNGTEMGVKREERGKRDGEREIERF